MSNYDAVPRPFILEPPLGSRTEYEPGADLAFRLTLIGKAIDYFPYFIVAFRELGEYGLGRGRGRFDLTEVRSIYDTTGEESLIYLSRDNLVRNRLLIIDVPRLREEAHSLNVAIRDGQAGEQQLGLNFLTPARFKYRGQLVDVPEFHIVIRNLLRRISSMTRFHHGFEPNVDFKGLVLGAEQVRLLADRTSWLDWERYSSRQQTRMKLGGIVGRADYEGVLQAFIPLLVLGRYLHVGKNATFGLGKFRICTNHRVDVPATEALRG